MSGLTKFATSAFPVAGPVEELDLVRGRIHVWLRQYSTSSECFSYCVAVVLVGIARYSACDGANCTCASMGLHGQTAQLH